MPPCPFRTPIFEMLRCGPRSNEPGTVDMSFSRWTGQALAFQRGPDLRTCSVPVGGATSSGYLPTGVQ